MTSQPRDELIMIGDHACLISLLLACVLFVGLFSKLPSCVVVLGNSIKVFKTENLGFIGLHF